MYLISEKNESNKNKVGVIEFNNKKDDLAQKMEYISFFDKYLKVTKEPIRAAISKYAINKFIFEYLPAQEKNPDDQDIKKYNGTFTVSEIATKLNLKTNTAHHHIKKLLDDDIIQIVRKEPYKNVQKHFYALSEDGNKFRNYRTLFKDHADFRRISFLVALTNLIGELTVYRTHVEQLENDKNGDSKFLSWVDDLDATLYHFITSVSGRKEFLDAFREVIKKRGGFKFRAPKQEEQTFVAFLLLPPFLNESE